MVEKKREEPLSHMGKLAEQSVADSKKWFGDNACVYSISHHTLAATASLGKFANIVKKIERGSLDPKDAKVRMSLAMELTEVLVHTLNIAGLMRFDLDKTYMMVRSANEKQFAEERAKREGAKNG